MIDKTLRKIGCAYMGWRFHKSVNLGGGARMNISKSGVGFSVGGNGFRVAFMPDGRIRRAITIPGTGLSYIEDISSPKQTSESQGTYQSWTAAARVSAQDEVCQHFESACREHFRQVFAWKVKIFIMVVISFLLAIPSGIAASYFDMRLLIALPFPLLAFAAYLYIIKPPVPIEVEYEFSSEPNVYSKLCRFFVAINSCEDLYHVKGATSGIRARTNAGSTQNLQMDKIKVLRDPIAHIKSNIICFFVRLNGLEVYILPDITIIVKNRKDIKVIATSTIRVHYHTQNVIWRKKVPADSVVVGKTWQNVNNDGSRDRRFKDNYQVPICRFGALEISSPEGLHLVIYGSNAEKMRSAYHAVTHRVS